MPARLSNLEVMEVSLVDKAANKRKFLVLKSEKDVQEEMEGGDSMSKDQEVKEEVKKETKEAVVKPIMKSDGTPDFEAVPDNARPAFEAIWKSQQEAISKAAEYKQKLEKELDEKEIKTFVAKAAELGNLSVKAEDFGLVLKSASKNLSAEHFAELEKVLKSANDNAKIVLKEVGHSNPDASADISPLEQLHRKALEISKAESIGYHAAYAKMSKEKGNEALLNERNKKV